MDRLDGVKTLLVLAMVSFFAQTAPAACPDYDGYTCDGWVTDVAGVLSDEPSVEASAAAFVQDYGHQIAIVTVPDANGDIEAYANELGNAWGVGDAADDDGIVLVVGLAERETWLVAGPGLDLPEASVIAGLADSFFRNGNFDGGISAVIGGLDQTFAADSAGVDRPFSDGGSSGLGMGALGVIGGLLVAGGGMFVVQNRRTRRRSEQQRRQTIIDGVLARLQPSGHEVTLPDELFESPPPRSVRSGGGCRAGSGRSVRRADRSRIHLLGRGMEQSGSSRCSMLIGWPGSARCHSSSRSPASRICSRRVCSRQIGMLSAPATAAEFDVKITELQRLVDSLRPFRIARANQRLARQLAHRSIDTARGPAVVTDLGERFVRASPVLPDDVTIEESIALLEGAYVDAKARTDRLEEIYAQLPVDKARPAVAAALVDLEDDVDDAVADYERVRALLDKEAPELQRDGLSIPAVAAFLLMNNDEDDVDEFIETYTEHRSAGIEADDAIELAMAGLRSTKEMEDIRAEAGRLGLPVSITAALLAKWRGGRR